MYGYKEELASLEERIDSHERYAKYEINDWILEMINLKGGEKVLDIGCGIGKQAIEYAKVVGLRGVVVGIDISEDILRAAEERAKEEKVEIQFFKYNANNIPFDFANDDYFDLVSCCFAIYYLEDVQKFLLEVKKKLRSGGRIIVVGPTVENAKEMLNFHSKIFDEDLPQIYEKRMKYEVIPLIRKYFSNIKVTIFNNVLVFPTNEAFLSYYTSTLLFRKSSKSKNNKIYLKKMQDEVDLIIAQNRKFELHKQVFGILGYK